MNAYNKYIKEILTDFPSYALTADDQKVIGLGQKAEWLTQKLCVKKFRKSSVKENTRNDIFEKVLKSIKEDNPIYLIICFGGYKHFWNSSYPEVDWAEMFNLRFMSEYIAPLLAAHEPGVILDYESEDVILPLIDNYPEESLDKYAESFKKLIKIYSKCFPKNFKVNYVRSQEQFETSELLDKVNERMPEARSKWEKLTEKEKEESLHRSPRCILWKGKEDLSDLSGTEKQKRIEDSKIANELYYEVDFEFRDDYLTGDNHIPLVLSWGLCSENIDNWLTLGSTYSSVVDFWIGRGILEAREDKFVPRIVSQNQYKKIKGNLVSESASSVPLKNFKNIEVYEGRLEF